MTDQNSARYQLRLTWILGLTFGVVFFDRNAANFLIPFVRDELSLSYTQIGLLSSGLALTWALAGMLGGAISDRTGRRKAPLVAAIIAFSCCSFLSGLAGSFVMLLAARLLMGAAEGPILPISQSLMAEESSAENRGHNMGVMQNVGSALLGSFAAPIVLVAIAEHFGWRTSFFLAGLPGLAMAVVVWFWVKEPVRSPESPALDHGKPIGWLDLFRYRNMKLCMLISIAIVTWMVVGWTFLPQYYTQVLGFSPSVMSWQISVLGLSAAAFAFVVPRLSDRFGRRPVVAAFCTVGVIVPLAALLFRGPSPALAALVFFGWSASGTMPLFMGTIPSETIPPRMVATGLALVMGIGEVLGGVAGPTLAGVAADRWGLQAPLLIQAGCALAGGLLALGLKETAPRVVAVRAAILASS